MANQRTESATPSDLRDERRQRTDAELIDELRALAPLPPDGTQASMAARLHRMFLLEALSMLIAERRLASAIPLVLERMSVGLGDVNDDVAVEACNALAALAVLDAGVRAEVLGILRPLVANERLRAAAEQGLYDIREVTAREAHVMELTRAESQGIPLAATRTVRRCVVKLKQCPQTWEALAATATEGVKHCGECQREVYLCSSDDETLAHALQNHCIARSEPDGSELPRLMLGRPRVHIEIHEREERASRWRGRERGIAEALAYDLSKVKRRCPDCHYPVPDWRKTCYVCGLELGRTS